MSSDNGWTSAQAITAERNPNAAAETGGNFSVQTLPGSPISYMASGIYAGKK